MNILTEVKKKITVRYSARSLAESGPECSSLFQMVTKCLATLQTMLFSKTLQAGYALVQVSFSHSIRAYDFCFPPPSLRRTPVTHLASLVTMHGHPLRGRVPSCFPSLLFSYTCKNKMVLCPGKPQPEE